MEMQEQRRIPASRDKVWKALNDTDVLQQSMPGCEHFEETGENSYVARVTTKVGPVKARFKFNVELTEVDPPNGYVINGEGQGGAAGFAKGSASVDLEEDGDETLLSYAVKASVGGKLAQLGGRLIDGTAKKMADEFFDNFIAQVSPAPADNIDAAAGRGEPRARKSQTWIYATAGVVLVLVLLALLA